MPNQYTIKKGDTLWSIAKQHNVSFQVLKKANTQFKDPDQVFPGDKVIIPDEQLGNKKVGEICEQCQQEKQCIKIILMDEDRFPYAEELCWIKQEDEQVREGRLSEQGGVLFQALQAGNYLVEFPNFKLAKERSNYEPIVEEEAVECGTRSQRKIKFNQLAEPLKLDNFPTDKTHEVIVYKAREFIIIVGTEQHYNAFALKMMFFAPAVKDLKSDQYQNDIMTIIYFTDGYNKEEIEAVQSSVSSKSVNFVPVNTITEVIHYFNQPTAYYVDLKKEIPRKIGRIHIYAHGYPKKISFGLDGENAMNQILNEKNVKEIKSNHFTDETIFISYACRTGIGQWSEIFTHEADALPKESLAQTIADHLQIKMYAFLTRTNYSPIWHDRGDEVYRKNYTKIKHEGLQREGEDWWKIWHWGSDEDNYALWNQNGAYGSVKGGNTPKGLSNALKLFSPKKE
ncbi:MAG: LysM peptidoglycan-binding domain-containing protein [Pseudomonadota bacterium]|nr:LysM peptidoglycan-binding domain-containing protein [Pseudomonadota bacterium]